MLPAAVVIAGLAVPETPPQLPRQAIVIETSWSLSAGTAPAALIGPRLPTVQVSTAALSDQPVGPGQAVAPPVIEPAPSNEPKVEVLPEKGIEAPSPADELAESVKPADDPLEGFNRISFDVSQALDKVLIRPAAMAYKTVVPKPLRDGVRNGLSNLGEPLVLVNDILQLKPKRALRTLGRFLLNSILGLGGLFDVAKDKKFKLPHHQNSFSDTLGFYGVKPGPYIYLPVFGPTTLRDTVDQLQGTLSGAVVDNPVFRDNRGTVFQVVAGLDLRAESDDDLKALLSDAIDPYATFRSTWLQDRQGEIDALKAPDGADPGTQAPGTQNGASPLDDPLIDPAAPRAGQPEAKPEPPTPEKPAPADPLDDPLEGPAAKPAS